MTTTAKIITGAPQILLLLALLVAAPSLSEPASAADLEADFRRPPAAARPWVFWYWLNAAVSRRGITADLESMAAAGMGGAYLMPIQGVTEPPLLEPPVEQLSPQWWGMVRRAAAEADRLGLKLGMHACDGFAVAGGPWVTPKLSMQKVVWTQIHVDGGRRFDGQLPQPETREGYYRDIAVLAFPSLPGAGVSTRTIVPEVTTSQPGTEAHFLVSGTGDARFRSAGPCWIQYAFERPFTCRSITIRPDGRNLQANRLIVEVSEDGREFRRVASLKPPRHGWQDGDADVTHAVVPTTARFFRFLFDRAGSEPGAEDLDAGKWRPILKVRRIELFSEPRLHHFQGKSGAVWRIGPRTTTEQVPDCVPLERIAVITERLADNGRLNWQIPAGKWTILRLGHTSTGHRNETGGAGRGLECDKFNAAAVRLQFDRWFGEAIRQIGPQLASRVLKVFHVDSWECGSQNWSPSFGKEFQERRGYDPLRYLPAMAGIPVESAEVSERFLHDVRSTIADLIADVFFDTLADLAHTHGCSFSAESVAPTMTSDGMRHFDRADIPMGEFWLRSPTHDKPNDILDAVSGAHIYGKTIVQAEAFTQLRMAWDEHPAMLKALGDRNYCLGINRLVFHVFAHNPWLERRPGMTLGGGVGLFFQRDQTWWRPGRAWVEYAQRCQALLGRGRAVVDVAVFSGEETPRRAVLPERLVTTLSGIFGKAVVEREARRLANRGEPQRQLPKGVTHSANIADPADWIDPLRGYAYDSINRDALLRLANVEHGRLVLPGGACYGLLVLPGPRPMSPDGAQRMTPAVARRLRQLVAAGATVLLGGRPEASPSLQGYPAADEVVRQLAGELWGGAANGEGQEAGGVEGWRLGKGRLLAAPYRHSSFAPLGIEPDLEATDLSGASAEGIAWTHRVAAGTDEDTDIYFVSNQRSERRRIEVWLRVSGRAPELWDAVTGEIRRAGSWRLEGPRTVVPLLLEPSASIFVVLRQPTDRRRGEGGANGLQLGVAQSLQGEWRVAFDPSLGGPRAAVVFDRLETWTARPEPGIRYYSGTASYSRTFSWRPSGGMQRRVWLALGRVANLAEVVVNGVPCGVAWTAPYRVEITAALHAGENRLRIDVTNTWANRLMGDRSRPESGRLTWTTAPDRFAGEPLLEAGLLGPVQLLTE